MRNGVTLGGRFVLGEQLEHDIPGIDRHRARDQRLERDAVVDVVTSLSPAAIRQEATRASRLRDPRLARIVASGREEVDGKELSYVAYEQVPGVTLDTVMAERHLDVRLAVAVIGGAARGLAAARAAGLHHGFLRPSAITVTDRGRVVVGGIGVDGEAAWQAGLAPLRSEASDAGALAAILVACLTGLPVDDATVEDLPEGLGGRARALAVSTLEGDAPTALDQVVEALSPFDSRALMGFARAVDRLPLSRTRQPEADERERLAAAAAAAERAARIEATREILDEATVAEATLAAEVEVAQSRGDLDVQEVIRASDEARREAEDEPLRSDATTEAVPVVTSAGDQDGPADKYEAGFDTLEMMVAEQHAARTPGTWELVLSRLHERWPRSEAITHSLERARERANSGGPLNGARITLLIAIVGLGLAVWVALGWLNAPLSPDWVIEGTPTPEPTASATASPSPEASS